MPHFNPEMYRSPGSYCNIEYNNADKTIVTLVTSLKIYHFSGHLTNLPRFDIKTVFPFEVYIEYMRSNENHAWFYWFDIGIIVYDQSVQALAH